METIGETRGGKIVCMSNEEHDEFCRLERIVNGQYPTADREFQLGLHDDLGPVFSVIRAFVEAKFRVNELQEQVDLLRRVLEDRTEVESETIEESPA